MTDRPLLLMIAGPNGSGKTTFAKTYLSRYEQHLRFLNTDEIAQQISPGNVNKVAVQAARDVLSRIEEYLAADTSFAIETTLSGARQYRLIKEATSRGWKVDLVYLWIGSVNLAKSRVKDRVRLGGHSVPEQDIERRYWRGLRNLEEYIESCDETAVYDNRDRTPMLIAKYDSLGLTVYDDAEFARMINETRP